MTVRSTDPQGNKFDLGRITIGRDLVLYLYGAPDEPDELGGWTSMAAGMLGSIVVVDAMEECLQGAQELIDAIQAGVVRKEDLVELSEVVVGKKKGRTSPRQVTLFKSQGSGWQDVASAVRIYEQAVKKGMGKEVGVVGPPMRAPK